MTYSQSTLVKVARLMIHKHPDIAACCIEEVKPKRKDIKEIDQYFIRYKKITGPSITDHGKRSAEIKKVFIGCMLNLFSHQWGFNQAISSLLDQSAPVTSSMIKESECRYRIDSDFREKVDQTIIKIK